jgi:hypothetical protein
MRVTPLLGSKVWFGPRRYGWGWSPVSWEGWAVMAAYVVGVLVVVPLAARGTTAALALVGVTAALMAVCVVKGTAPGGPEAADRFRTWQRGQRRTPEEVEHDRRLRHDVPDEPSVTDAAARLRRFRRPGAS